MLEIFEGWRNSSMTFKLMRVRLFWLIRKLQRASGGARRRAAQELIELGQPAGLKAVLDLDDEALNLEKWEAALIYGMHDEGAVQWLVDHLTDNSFHAKVLGTYSWTHDLASRIRDLEKLLTWPRSLSPRVKRSLLALKDFEYETYVDDPGTFDIEGKVRPTEGFTGFVTSKMSFERLRELARAASTSW